MTERQRQGVRHTQNIPFCWCCPQTLHNIRNHKANHWTRLNAAVIVLSHKAIPPCGNITWFWLSLSPLERQNKWMKNQHECVGFYEFYAPAHTLPHTQCTVHTNIGKRGFALSLISFHCYRSTDTPMGQLQFNQKNARWLLCGFVQVPIKINTNHSSIHQRLLQCVP